MTFFIESSEVNCSCRLTVPLTKLLHKLVLRGWGYEYKNPTDEVVEKLNFNFSREMSEAPSSLRQSLLR